jgi:hypothetical protein
MRSCLYPECEVRRACADLLEVNESLVCDESGFIEIRGLRYGTVWSFSQLWGFDNTAVARLLRRSGAKSIKGRNRSGMVCEFYPEPAVREACANMLATLPVADESGCIKINGIQYGTCRAFSKLLGLSNSTIASRLQSADLKIVRGRDKGGRVFDFYPEPKVRELCADIAVFVPMADESGFILLGGIRFGTPTSLARLLDLSEPTISGRISDARLLPKRGKDIQGKVRDFYPETAVREACSELLVSMPLAEKSGFFEKGGVRYGTLTSLSREFKKRSSDLGRILKNLNVTSLRAKMPGGQIFDFYPEPVVRELIHQTSLMSRANSKSGLVMIDGIRHGTLYGLASSLGVGEKTIRACVRSSGLASVPAKSRNGRIRDFYPEPRVAELLKIYKSRGSSSFSIVNGVRHGHLNAWAEELGISNKAIADYLAGASVSPIELINRQGRKLKYYSEPDIKRVCADILGFEIQADGSGISVLNGIRYGSIPAWARELGISIKAILSRIGHAEGAIRGKNKKNGKIIDFYPEPEIIRVCAEVLRPLPQADEQGWLILEGVRHATIRTWARVLEVSDPYITSHLGSLEIKPTRGKMKGGQIHDFYPEPAIRELCKDLIERKKSNPKPR